MSDEITTAQAATLLGEWLGKSTVSTKTIYRLLAAGTIESSKPCGNRVGHRISRAVLENWFKRRKVETTNRRRAAK